MVRRLWVPAVPFCFSLALSLATVGTKVDWQDSGFYIAAVREFGVLYPPGFVLYLTLCRLWTILVFFLDFILAVNLFSSLMAALAAGTLALAARDLLRTQGPIFRVSQEDPATLGDACGVAIGCLAASGYTYWYAGILAKGYALYYFVLTLLLWRMIRADATRAPSEFTRVAALIGLAWQAHPSATNAGLALLVFVLFHQRVLGWKGLAWRTLLSAGCALGPALVLPFLSSRLTITEFGGPDSFGDLVRYLRGARFTDQADVFGVDSSRIKSASQYFWEEFLGVGLALGAWGVSRMALRHRRALLGLGLWMLPIILVTTLFKIEGQHDLWLVAAWIPFWLAAAVGLKNIAEGLPRHRSWAVAGVALVGVGWASIENGPLVSRRGYELPEILGRLYLDKLEKDSILLIISDDATAIARCLQAVYGYRSDVLLVREEDLEVNERGDPGRAYRRLQRRRPELQALRFSDLKAGVERGAVGRDVLALAFLNANAQIGRQIYVERTPQAVELLRADYTLAPAGPLMKLEPKPGSALDPRYWETPISAEQVHARFRRARGQLVEYVAGHFRVRPQPYEDRLLGALLRARQMLASSLFRGSSPENWKRSAELYRSILQLRPDAEKDARILVPLGICLFRLGEFDQAEAYLVQSLWLDLPSRGRAEAAATLGQLCLKRNRPREAEEYFNRARQEPDISPETREILDRLARPH